MRLEVPETDRADRRPACRAGPGALETFEDALPKRTAVRPELGRAIEQLQGMVEIAVELADDERAQELRTVLLGAFPRRQKVCERLRAPEVESFTDDHLALAAT